MAGLYIARIKRLNAETDALGRRIAAAAKASDDMRRLRTAPGIAPVCAMAIAALAPDTREFRSGRDIAASLGPVPATALEQRTLGRTLKMDSAKSGGC